MSKLGWICQINFDEKGNATKDIFPIVYENKSYWYYKHYGSDMLSYAVKPDARRTGSFWNEVIPYSKFRADYSIMPRPKNKSYIIYVAPDETKDFTWIKTRSPIEIKIEKLQLDIITYERQQEVCIRQKYNAEKTIEKTEKSIQNAKEQIDVLRKELEENE